MARSQAEEKKLQERRAELALEDMRALLGRVEFRRFLGRLFNVCGLYDSDYIGSSEIYFKQGRRSVANDILNEIKAVDPEAYPRMQMELLREDAKYA